ncbi:ATP synthase F(0) complex subunit f, mitochondrial-like [Clavelina lepadiformis]|uniref:ATP synthase subunit f, mitochondrial n=1 Tax=Clavelina lepadiformis TaxID=159417 RepID=A0ABP0FQU1_CLALP
MAGKADLANLAQHPKYYASKLEPGMKLPADTRLLRDVKLYEVPGWFSQRNFSPLGLWFSFKRFRHQLWSKYYHVRRPGGNLVAMLAGSAAVLMYITDYRDMKSHMLRKYH